MAGHQRGGDHSDRGERDDGNEILRQLPQTDFRLPPKSRAGRKKKKDQNDVGRQPVRPMRLVDAPAKWEDAKSSAPAPPKTSATMYGIRERIAIAAITDAATGNQIRNSTVELAVISSPRADAHGTSGRADE
jgi:hypothetical protein